MVNLVEWEVSISAVQVVISSALTSRENDLLVDTTLLMGALFKYMF